MLRSIIFFTAGFGLLFFHSRWASNWSVILGLLCVVAGLVILVFTIEANDKTMYEDFKKLQIKISVHACYNNFHDLNKEIEDFESKHKGKQDVLFYTDKLESTLFKTLNLHV
jgi:hypothetical protein